MTITFITGATRGIGYETARRLSNLGHTVLLGARDPERGRAAAEELGVRSVTIDVTNDQSVADAVADIRAHEGHIDTLINNAGIRGTRNPVEEFTGADATEVFDTNVVSIVRVTSAFVPLLRLSDAPSIINVGSSLASFERLSDPDSFESAFVAPIYIASKAAVNMLTVQYSRAFPDIRVNVVDPGWTATGLSENRGTQTVTEGTDAIVAVATEGADAATARFVSRHGAVSW